MPPSVWREGGHGAKRAPWRSRSWRIHDRQGAHVVTAQLTMIAKVGRRWRVTFTIEGAASGVGASVLQMAWRPNVPNRLSRKELRDYRRARDAFMAEVARFIGGA